MQNDLTIIYYTSNYLEETNPYFLNNTKKWLVRALENIPMVVVSHKPISKESFIGYEGEYTNLVAGRDFELRSEGRSHLNIYWQMLIGAREAKTPYVANVEDDILYTHSHFHSREIKKLIELNTQKFLYDMNKVSLFTWTSPPIFSFRSKRMVVNQLISPRTMLINALEERFKRVEELLNSGRKLEWILHYFGDLGRYENTLGVTIQPTYQYFSQSPSIVFTHPEAYGFLNHGTRKAHGDIKIVELLDWGRADQVLKLWGTNPLK